MPTKPSAYTSSLTFSSGNSIVLNPHDKIILVGPNNSGKSQTLRDIVELCEWGKNASPTALADLEVTKSGTARDLRTFLRDNAEYTDRRYRFRDWELSEFDISSWDDPYLRYPLTNGFLKMITADDRLVICNLQESIGPDERKSKPQHILYEDDTLMAKISRLFKRAFNKDLLFDYRGGRNLPIHVGELPSITGVTDRVSDAYVRAVRDNPRLDQQGDGMKSYAGILFEAIVANRDVTLIDEPEAFLHPPQMRRLGETLSSEVGGQLIVATHSSDILRGFLEGTRGNVRILRIRREGNVNKVFEAAPEVVRELWEKPELRYSNALEGIFHEQTIICEDDSDCRLINSVADHLSNGSNPQWQDTAYVPTGGKHGIPKVATILRRTGVPTKAVFDIDFLAEGELVQLTVQAFGGDWNEIGPLWNRVNSAVRRGIPAKIADQIKQEIIDLLNRSEHGILPKREIHEAMKQDKPWAEVKKYGTRAIPKGDAQSTYLQLRNRLEDIGIYLIPVGEIENFCPDIGSHGPKFVTKLLSDVPLSDNRLADLRTFVKRVHTGPHCRLEP